MSSSLAIRSSGKKRGDCESSGWMASVAATNATESRARYLEDIAKHDEEMLAFAAAKPGVDPKDRAVVGVETKTEPIVCFEVLEVEVVALHLHLARVVKERRIES